MARPDPVALAERLFELEMESEFGAFHQAVAVYADVLGEAGRAAYRRLAETAWAKVPALGPGDQDPNRYGGRYRITSIMEAVARADGDLEALVAVKSRDLSLPHAFLEIAELYQEAGNADRALEWAERAGGRSRTRAPTSACGPSSPTPISARAAATKRWRWCGRRSPKAPGSGPTNSWNGTANVRGNGPPGANGPCP